VGPQELVGVEGHVGAQNGPENGGIPKSFKGYVWLVVTGTWLLFLHFIYGIILVNHD